MIPVSEALQRVLDGVHPVSGEIVTLNDAAGRIIAEDVRALLTQPPFDASAMDGYALRTADIAQLPVKLNLIGTSKAGRAASRSVAPGEAIRIFTGAPVPEGANAVAIQEDCTASDDAITVNSYSTSGNNIRQRGQDFAENDVLIRSGAKLNARLITLAAAAGHPGLTVRRKPKVAIVATGDELVPPGIIPGPDQIISSNPYGLAAMVTAAGGLPVLLGIARDEREDLDRMLSSAAKADIVVTIGGASVGDHDLVKPALEGLGAKLIFAKIAMRPGKPTIFGRLGAARVIGLPGNPVSCLVSARVFLVPLILALLGQHDAATPETAVLADDIPANGPREHYMRAKFVRSGGETRIAPLPSQDSSLLAALASAEALLINPPNAPALQTGTSVGFLRLDF